MKLTSDILLESLPYIYKFRDKIVVIKIGGSIIEQSELKESFAKDICYLRAIGVKVIVVHGGGKKVTEVLEKAGHQTRFVDGYRYTGAEDMDLVEMVLSGNLCKELVSYLNQAGGKAVGLSGRDASLLRLEKLKSNSGEDLGQSGRVVGVNSEILNLLTSNEYIPVISSVGYFYDGSAGNVNADEVASVIAASLKAIKLVYVSDVDGLFMEGRKIDEADLKEAESFIKLGLAKDGMLPKLESTISALRSGIDEVHFVNGTCRHSLLIELFTDKGIGTKFSYTRRKK